MSKPASRVRQFEAFHAVVETSSVTRAAELLQISQPAVSALVRALEADTGLQLFQRIRRRLVPTQEAHRLYAEVSRLLGAFAHVEHVANEIRSVGVGALRIAALPALGLRMIPEVLALLRRNHPGIDLALAIGTSQTVAELVSFGHADIGFILPVPGLGQLTVRTLARLPAVVVLPRNHRLAASTSLTPEDLQGEQFISLGQEVPSQRLINSLFDDQNVPRTLGVEMQYGATICEMVACGAGVSIVDPVTAWAYADRVVTRRITPTVTFQIDVLTRTGQPTSAIVSSLLHDLRRRLRAIASRGNGAEELTLSRH